MQTIRNLLKKTSVNNVGSTEQSVVSDYTTSSLSAALKKLSTHHIHSLPIRDSKNNWTSFLDLSDIVHHMFENFADEELKHIPKIMEFQGEYLKVLDAKDKLWEVNHTEVPDPAKVEKFRSKKIGEVAHHEFHPLQEGATLYDVMQMLNKYPLLKRVPITSKTNELKRLVTPMDIIGFLAKSDLGAAGQLKVKDLHLDTGKDVISISKNTTALEGFRLMTSNNITGVAVVDDQKRLIGNLSNSDLKAIMYDAREFINLYLPVDDYLKKVRQKDSTTPVSDISVTSESTVSQLLNLFSNHHIHRVFVVENDHRLKGVITLGDFLSAIDTPSTA